MFPNACLRPVVSVIVASALTFAWAVLPAQAITLEWTKQPGSSADDRDGGVSADGLGNVYISGRTSGSLGGPNAGPDDAFLAKYDAAGILKWTRQLGSSDYDESQAVSADALGNVYIAGRTFGSLGGPRSSPFAPFLAKYDAGGLLQWTKQLGTLGSGDAFGVSADGLGNVYMSGSTGDRRAFLTKYDASGNLTWTRQLGGSNQDGSGSSSVSTDRLGNVFISGTTFESLAGPNAGGVDAFVAKYDAAGSLLWTRQLGTSARDLSYGASADGLGNVYITGETGFDAFIAKYDAFGNFQWTKQLHSNGEVTPKGISADGQGNVYIAGLTDGSLGGPNAGQWDAFVAEYDAAGNLQWTKQLGTSASDSSNGVSADGLGSVYISGSTNGSLGGPSAGVYDVFVAKYSDAVPEPTAIALCFLAMIPLGFSHRRFR